MTQRFTTSAKKVEAARLMVEGLTAHKNEILASGISADFIQKLDLQRQKVEKAEALQERLKAEKILSTQSLMQETKELMKFYKRARTIVKNDLPKGGWLEFGIIAKH